MIETLASILVGIITSLAAEYMPIIKRWLAGLIPWQRVLFFVVLSLAYAFGMAVYNSGGITQELLKPGVLLKLFVGALTAWMSTGGTRNFWRFVTTKRAAITPEATSTNE